MAQWPRELNDDPLNRLNRSVVCLAGIVYFVQGALGIASVALPLYLRSQNYSIAKITFITSIATAPWFIKIVYGAVSDALPIGGLRRKPYLILCSALSCAGWTLLSVVPASTFFLIMAMMVGHLGLAATDVITDGLVVDHSTSVTAQTYQSISWGARSVGALLSGVTGGYLAAQVPARLIFLITGILPLISLFAALLFREAPAARPAVKNILRPIWACLKHLLHGDLKWFSVFLAVMSLSAAIGTPFFFYMREGLGFDEILLGLLQSISWLGAIVGCGLYLKLFHKVPLKATLYWAVLVGFVGTLFVLVVSGPVSAYLLFFVAGVLGYVSFLPLMSSAAKLAHGTGVEGSLFAVLMSVFNLGQVSAATLGGFLFERIGFTPLVIATAFFGLIGLWILPKLERL